MNEAQVKSVSPAHLCLLLASANPPLLLDVRTPPEFNAAHVPGAMLIPLDDLEPAACLKSHSSGHAFYVICQSGARARKAIERFHSCGCNDAVLVEGGTQAWIDAGLPVNRGTASVLPIMRQVQIVVGSLSVLSALLALTVSSWFALIPLLLGSGLLFAGLTGTCGMAILLARMPWNRTNSQPLQLSNTPERS
ncbi:rhodanese-like domain-containing protein [Occallatibacter savannae]|uniref:rhodanese-like domain-containing protein n=1 Tax=Occallatibacter savannae TaxID=1002691 RepID=UPI000D695D5A|nr:rhodanese-like domain-containing protein [Occallatibacter savannae]